MPDNAISIAVLVVAFLVAAVVAKLVRRAVERRRDRQRQALPSDASRQVRRAAALRERRGTRRR